MGYKKSKPEYELVKKYETPGMKVTVRKKKKQPTGQDIFKGDNAKGDPWFNVKAPPVNVKGGKRSKEEVAKLIAKRKNPKDRMTIEYRNGKKVYVVAPKKKK